MKFSFIAKHRVIWPAGWLCGALSARPIHSSFEHSQNNIVIASDVAPNFGRLLIIQSVGVGRPLVASIAGNLVHDRIGAGVQLLVNLQDQLAEIGKIRRP